MTAAERLKEARRLAGYRSARAAARAMDMPTATYIQHENGSRGMHVETFENYLSFFALQATTRRLEASA